MCAERNVERVKLLDIEHTDGQTGCHGQSQADVPVETLLSALKLMIASPSFVSVASTARGRGDRGGEGDRDMRTCLPTL